jgi:Zn-dependent protease/predicted transcriptional regulator
MDWSLTLGSIHGIKIRIHVTFLLVMVWAAYNWGTVLRGGWSGAAYGVAFTIVVFFCVVLHELAHGLVATRYGVNVHEIELSPIGGLARMDSVPEAPSQELTMALAGPLVNLLLAVPLGIVVALLIRNHAIKSPGHLLYLMRKPSLQGFVLNLFATNIFLALFNLLPAFPMDGGRALRSVLSWAIGRSSATNLATAIGQWLAAVMGFAGLLVGNLVMALIGAFVFMSARQEQQLSNLQGILGDVPVSEALGTTFSTLSPHDTLDTVLERTRHGQAAPFAVLESSRLVGLLTTADITTALETYGVSAVVGHIMRQDAPVLSPTDTLAYASQLMARSGLAGLPVTQDGQLLGMVTRQQIQQIYRFLAAQRRRQSHSLRL